MGRGSPGGRTAALNGDRKSVKLLVTAGRKYEGGKNEGRTVQDADYGLLRRSSNWRGNIGVVNGGRRGRHDPLCEIKKIRGRFS